MLEDNPYQRNTQDVPNKQAIEDLNNVRKIMLLSTDKQFQKIEQFIEQTINKKDKQFYPQNLESELNFHELFYSTVQNGQMQDEVKHQEHPIELRLRILTLGINSKLKNNKNVSQDQINQLIKMVGSVPESKQEVMMKFVGCWDVQRMKQISKEEIDDLTPDVQKKAIKYQIAADWKFIIGCNDQALQFKQQAIVAWGSTQKNNKKAECKLELEMLTKLCKGQKTKGRYANKLETLKAIIEQLNKIPELNAIQNLRKCKKKAAIQTLLPQTLKKFEMPVAQKSKQDKNLTSSVLKKKGLLEQRRQIGKSFYQQIQKNNFLYLNFVPENRFLSNKIYMSKNPKESEDVNNQS